MAFLDPSKKYIEQFWNELYIEMLSDPHDMRTDKQFCVDIGIGETTLKTWKSKYRLQIFEEVQKRRAQYIAQKRNKLDRALDKKIELGDTNAIKLGYQLLGDLVDKSEIKHSGMDRNDKEKRIFNLLGEIRKKEENWGKAKQGSEDREGKTSDDSKSLGDEPGENPSNSGTV